MASLIQCEFSNLARGYHPGWIRAKRQYLNRIRNKEKRAYGEAYFAYLTSWRSEPNEAEYNLSYMAKQAVRTNLRQGI